MGGAQLGGARNIFTTIPGPNGKITLPSSTLRPFTCAPHDGINLLLARKFRSDEAPGQMWKKIDVLVTEYSSTLEALGADYGPRLRGCGVVPKAPRPEKGTSTAEKDSAPNGAVSIVMGFWEMRNHADSLLWNVSELNRSYEKMIKDVIRKHVKGEFSWSTLKYGYMCIRKTSCKPLEWGGRLLYGLAGTLVGFAVLRPFLHGNAAERLAQFPYAVDQAFHSTQGKMSLIVGAVAGMVAFEVISAGICIMLSACYKTHFTAKRVYELMLETGLLPKTMMKIKEDKEMPCLRPEKGS